jgi:hypothetical protein
MGLREFFAGEGRAVTQERPVMRPACTCGSRSFSAGGQAVSPLCDAVRAWVEPSGAVLSCLSCGRRWYTTPDGLREPHRDAMPPAWAAMDMQREAVERRAAQVEGAREAARLNGPAKRPIAREMRTPPRPV